MPTVKFYRDEEKQHQVYPDIDPDGIFPGVTVGLANNLTSPDGLSDTAKWHWRTAGGEQDISDGYADLTTLKGASESSTIEESIHVNVLASGVKQATVTKDTFKTQKSETGTYNFTYTPKVTYSSEYVYSLDNNQFARQTRQQTNTYTFRYQAIVGQGEGSETYINELNSSTFVEKVNEEPNTYTFKHEGEQ